MPKVSVIVPVYNVEKYIGRCIESIQKQTLKEWELILVDDCSQDNSPSLMREYARKDKRIQLLFLEENHGPMVARRRGDEIAIGEYITYCDSDDWFSNDALEILYNAASGANADIVTGQIKKVFGDGIEKPFDIHNTLMYGDSREALLKSILRREIHQGIAGKMFKREVVQQKNFTVLEHCTMSEDAAVLFQYVDKSNRACVVEDFIYNYYMRPESTTHTNRTAIQVENMCMTTVLRMEIASKYPSLFIDMNRYFIMNLVGDSRKYKDLLTKYNLNPLLTRRNILNCFPFLKAVKLIVRRDLFIL